MGEVMNEPIPDPGTVLFREMGRMRAVVRLLTEVDSSPNAIDTSVVSDTAFVVLEMLKKMDATLSELDIQYEPVIWDACGY